MHAYITQALAEERIRDWHRQAGQSRLRREARRARRHQGQRGWHSPAPVRAPVRSLPAPVARLVPGPRRGGSDQPAPAGEGRPASRPAA